METVENVGFPMMCPLLVCAGSRREQRRGCEAGCHRMWELEEAHAPYAVPAMEAIPLVKVHSAPLHRRFRCNLMGQTQTLHPVLPKSNQGPTCHKQVAPRLQRRIAPHQFAVSSRTGPLRDE